ncbi:site-specific integrase [Bosea sp. F3-2]|uniref:tyrosine-type recombinase/integrase n=1 Tax=Bosea sp. F3-2 TaxID=2599640 RepID=UPI0011EE50FB|nr:site-specific integrase [Bosea sp. F3-2]QEL21904.1 site-specific integrase [Bosea sp. F3-2]
MATVFLPDSSRLTELGYGRVAHVPVLFDAEGRYCREINRYLRARATLDWHPMMDASEVGRDFPRQASLISMAYELKNFNDWCRDRKLDWRGLSYEDIRAYQADLLGGRWSARPRHKLKAETANARADQATHFLRWAADQGLRSPFTIPMIEKVRAIRSRGSSIATRAIVRVRAGRAKRSNTTEIAKVVMLPTVEEIREWLTSLQKARGYAKALACRMIIEVGLRRMEVCGLTVDMIPSGEALEALHRKGIPSAPVSITLTKGGRPRTVQVPLPLAGELRTWIDTRRMTLALRFRRRTGSMPSNALFLSDASGFEGIPLAGHTIYKAFKAEPRPAAWHPHFGRHVFACFYVLHALNLDAAAAGGTIADQGADWLQLRGRFWLDMLRRQLGHVSDETTDLYLRWLATATSVASMANGWHDFLNLPHASEEIV